MSDVHLLLTLECLKITALPYPFRYGDIQFIRSDVRNFRRRLPKSVTVYFVRLRYPAIRFGEAKISGHVIRQYLLTMHDANSRISHGKSQGTL
jgi:hypothetical protein